MRRLSIALKRLTRGIASRRAASRGRAPVSTPHECCAPSIRRGRSGCKLRLSRHTTDNRQRTCEHPQECTIELWQLVQRAALPAADDSQLGREFSVSRQTVRKWLARSRAEGAAGRRDRSSRPATSPTRLPRARRRQIERRRRQRHSSPRIARELQLPLATVMREQRRLGLNRLNRLDPPKPAQRYEWPAAGDLLHLDIKSAARSGRSTIVFTRIAVAKARNRLGGGARRDRRLHPPRVR